jgi:hypothetical protein
MTTLLSGALAMTTLLETTSLVHKEMSVWLTRDLIVAHYWAPDAVLKRAPATQVSNGMQNVGVNLRQQAQCNQCLPESFSPKRLLDANKSVGNVSFLAHKLVRWILVFVHHLTPRDVRNDSVPRWYHLYCAMEVVNPLHGTLANHIHDIMIIYQPVETTTGSIDTNC